MIISMSDILCITNRSLCHEKFLQRIAEIAACRPAGIILREKDLTPGEYAVLAASVLEICAAYQTRCILHSFADAAVDLDTREIHLPLASLASMDEWKRAYFEVIGVSCHSMEEAKRAEQLGASYLTIGNIYATECKKGLPGKGVSFLREIVRAVNLPVYAIGGINHDNISAVRAAGAAGGCVMSGVMLAENPEKYLQQFEGGTENESLS